MEITTPSTSFFETTTGRRITLIGLIIQTLIALGMILFITPLSLLIMVSGPAGTGEPSFGTDLVGYVGMAYAVIAVLAPIAGWVLFFRRSHLWALVAGLAPLGWFIVWLISFGVMAG